jgi:ABC-type dipeptide/oligopeptide/nickel transport system permease subunit
MTVTLAQEEQETEGLTAAPPRRPLASLRRNPLAVISFVVLTVIVLLAIFYPMVSAYRYDHHTDDIAFPPSAKHLLGTDDSGYDVMTQLCVGARISLGVGVGTELIIVFVGGVLGLLAGFYGKGVDQALMRFTDMMFSFPDILLAILIMSVRGPSIANLFVALSVAGWPGLARLVRGQTLALQKREFVEAARAIGLRDSRILFRHIVPNLLSPLIVACTIDIAGIIIAESTLSFLGIGVQVPMPSWGAMISHAMNSGFWRAQPLLVVAPAVALSLTVLSLNFLGDALRDALDPRSR